MPEQWLPRPRRPDRMLSENKFLTLISSSNACIVLSNFQFNLRHWRWIAHLRFLTIAKLLNPLHATTSVARGRAPHDIHLTWDFRLESTISCMTIRNRSNSHERYKRIAIKWQAFNTLKVHVLFANDRRRLGQCICLRMKTTLRQMILKRKPIGCVRFHFICEIIS